MAFLIEWIGLDTKSESGIFQTDTGFPRYPGPWMLGSDEPSSLDSDEAAIKGIYLSVVAPDRG
jgi:hypothetical protein